MANLNMVPGNSLSILLLLLIKSFILRSATVYGRPRIDNGTALQSLSRSPGKPIQLRMLQPTQPLLAPDEPLSDQPWSAFNYPQADPFTYNGLPRPDVRLGSPTDSSQCATIVTTNNVAVSVPDDAEVKDVSLHQFVIWTGVVWNQCSLSIRDCSGYTFTTSGSTVPSSYNCRTAQTVCCECNGCNRDIRQHTDGIEVCAFLFEQDDCSQCVGFRLEVLSGDNVAVMDPLVDNRVSSVKVRPGCELIVYTEGDFQGRGAIATGLHDRLPPDWDNVISSYSCACASSNETTTEQAVFTTTQATTTIKDFPTTSQSTTLSPSTLITTTTVVTTTEATETTPKEPTPPVTTTTSTTVTPEPTIVTTEPTTKLSTSTMKSTTEMMTESSLTTTTELQDNVEY